MPVADTSAQPAWLIHASKRFMACSRSEDRPVDRQDSTRGVRRRARGQRRAGDGADARAASRARRRACARKTARTTAPGGGTPPARRTRGPRCGRWCPRAARRIISVSAAVRTTCVSKYAVPSCAAFRCSDVGRDERSGRPVRSRLLLNGLLLRRGQEDACAARRPPRPGTRGEAPPPATGRLSPRRRPERRGGEGARRLPPRRPACVSEHVSECRVPLVHSRRGAILAPLPIRLEHELLDRLEGDADRQDAGVVLRIASVPRGDTRLRVERS